MGGEFPERDKPGTPGMGGDYPKPTPERGGTGGEFPERGEDKPGGMGGQYPEDSQVPTTSGDPARGKVGVRSQPPGTTPNVPEPSPPDGAPD